MVRHWKEPTWLTAQIVMAIHDDLLRQHGGFPGLRDEGLFESALARPRNRWAYGEASDLFECAASYGFGIAENHAFNDGNKRTAFQTMYTFLGLNGLELETSEADAVTTMIGLADGRITEKQLAAWLRANCARRPKGK